MTPTYPRRLAAVIALGAIALLSAFEAKQAPAGELAAIVRAFIGLDRGADWSALSRVPGIRWTGTQRAELPRCLPHGDCFAWQGTATVGGHPMTVMATGARSMVLNLFIRNTAAPIGEEPLLAALRQAGMTPELARCPVTGGAGATTWYTLKGPPAGVISIQTVRGARPSEGFVLTTGEALPDLQPSQVSLYTEQCTPGAARTAAPRVVPHERLAEVVVALLVPASAPSLAWSALPGLATGIEWDPSGPKQFGTAPKTQSGSANYGGRRFSVQASGTATQVNVITLEETGGHHARGEHMLGVVYTKGIAVRLVRCGPVYTESTNNWYSMNSSRTRPAMIRQSLSWEGNNVNSVMDTYEVRLDGSLPTRDPRDRDPGVSGCQ